MQTIFKAHENVVLVNGQNIEIDANNPLVCAFNVDAKLVNRRSPQPVRLSTSSALELGTNENPLSVQIY